MFFSGRNLSPDIQNVFSLSSTLCIEDQIKFLDLLISTKDRIGKKDLIDRALIGERVWETKKAG